jgi:hypothetical protein
VRVDGQELDIRREGRTSGQLTAKSVSIKGAKHRSGDCAQKAAELTVHSSEGAISYVTVTPFTWVSPMGTNCELRPSIRECLGPLPTSRTVPDFESEPVNRVLKSANSCAFPPAARLTSFSAKATGEGHSILSSRPRY